MEPEARDCEVEQAGVEVLHEHEVCRQSTNSDTGHCYCWRNRTKFCCSCGAVFPHAVGDRLELVDPTPRIRAHVTSVSDGGYFTVKWEDGGFYKNYPPTDIPKFKSLGTNVRNTGND